MEILKCKYLKTVYKSHPANFWLFPLTFKLNINANVETTKQKMVLYK